MQTKARTVFGVLILTLAPMCAVAQYESTPPPGESPPSPPASGPSNGAGPSGGGAYLHLQPKNGQSEQQQWSDRYECHRWARTESGYDPTQQAAGTPPSESSSKAAEYRRSMVACLQSRGYEVHYGAAPTSTPVPPSPPPPMRSAQVRTVYSAPQLRYKPLSVQIDGGYSIATGGTDRFFDDGANIGLGFTWFPTSMLPVGLRVDGSYSRFRARRELRDLYGGDFTSGHDDLYGGDVDLQLNLADTPSWMRLYLFGGAGWYREQTYLRQVSWVQGDVCGWYFCGPGYYPAVTASERVTSPWHSSWNAGLGWELATGEGASFFVEARYQQIAAYHEKLQFVPIRVGLRF